MQKQRKSFFLQLAGLLCVLALLTTACSNGATNTNQDAPQLPPQNTPTTAPTKTTAKIEQSQSQGNINAILKYWTHDKMTKAINIDGLVKNLPQIKQVAADAMKTNPQLSKLQLPTGKMPNINMSPEDLQELLKQLAELAGQSSISSPSNSASLLSMFSQYSSYKPAGAYSYPLSTVGKVFFSTGGKDYVCSGAAVNSPNKSTVNTAGHCVYGNGRWMDNWVFCPQYYNGNAPFGCWAANYLYADSTWMKSATISEDKGFQGDFPHDFGLAVMHPSTRYGSLVDTVGGLGYLYSANASQTFYAYGYPAVSPYNGQSMKSCSGGDQVEDWNEDNYMLSIPCPMTGGASGGPWIVKYNGGWYLNGHNSFKAYKYPDRFYSPYYGDLWFSVFKAAANSSPGDPA